MLQGLVSQISRYVLSDPRESADASIASVPVEGYRCQLTTSYASDLAIRISNAQLVNVLPEALKWKTTTDTALYIREENPPMGIGYSAHT